MHPDVTRVEVIPPYGLRLAFADGTRRCAIRPSSPKVFVDAEAGTIAWPHEIDIDPDTLYEWAHASPEPG